MSARKARGFTLVEMLVTLVLFGMISTLLWQALGQVARIEAQLADSRVLGERDALQRAWVQQALAGVATGPLGDTRRFEGTATRLEAYATMPPWPVAGGLERMVLELRSEDGPVATGGRRTAVHGRSADGSATSPPLPLWTWDGEGRFEYLDREQRWQPRWPPLLNGGTAGPAGAAGSAQALPLAVRLVGPPSGALIVPVLATQNPVISRRDVPESDVPR